MRARHIRPFLPIALVLAVAACGGGGRPAATAATAAPAAMTVASGAFADGQPIPDDYSCRNGDIQPPVSWSGAPQGTAEFALIMDDADANGFVHWVVTGIPKDATALADPLPEGAVEGVNGKGQPGYTGPCPPSGTHHYTITVYALSAPLGLSSSATADAVRAAAAGKTLATGSLTGTYTPSS